MNTKIRSSVIAISITITLTILKFIFYYISGSVAVLSEAWHSGSDIATSLIVLFALWRNATLEKKVRIEESTEEETHGKLSRLIKNLWGKNIENTTSLMIGTLLTTISVSLIVNALTKQTIVIQKPLVTGFIFLFLSLGSYFLFKFLSAVGQSENSAALISDGLHSKADMLCSSFTGISLILYYFGLNIDRWVSLAIALLILSIGIEIIINNIIFFYKKDNEFKINHSFLNIIEFILTKDNYIHTYDWMRERFNIGILNSNKVTSTIYFFYKNTKYIIVVILFLMISYSSIFQVEMDEEAIIERFGKPVEDQIFQPGLHIKFPAPIDIVKKEKTKRIQEISLGNISKKERKPLIWGKRHGKEVHFISGDNNFFDPYIVIQYKIKDLNSFLYKVNGSKALIENIAYKALNNTFTTKTFYEISIKYRKTIEQSVHIILQKELDKIETGIEIVDVNLKDIHPPIKISKSFEEVIAAYQRKEEMINLALKYQNSKVPSSRGAAYSNVSNAQTYANEEVMKAQGEAVSYHSKLYPYKYNKSIVRKVLYLNSINKTTSNNDKIIIDPKAGKPAIYMQSKDIENSDIFPIEE